jgi:multidrug resistance protein, MATE family
LPELVIYVNKDILKLAIPSIISNISIPLLSSIDTALVGHLDQAYYLGGVAVGAMIFNFLFWGFGFLRMGTTGITAQAFGKGDQSESILTLGRALLVAIIGGVALVALQSLISWIAFQLVSSTPEVKAQAEIYYRIRIWSAPAVLAIYAFQGWFLGVQNARYPMIVAIAVNGIAIILDIFFLRALGMKTAGVALGSVIANYLGVLLALFLFLHTYRDYLGKIVKRRLLELSEARRFFSVNRDIFLRTLLLIVTYSFFTAKSASSGDSVLAANSILMQLWMVVSYGVDGFAYAAESLVGRFFGARDLENLKKTIRHLIAWGMGLSVIASLTYWLFGKQILGLFTDKQDVIHVAMAFFGWTIAAPVVNAVCFIWDGVFIGATATRTMLISMVLATLVFFLPIYYLTRGSLGNHSLWLAMTSFMAVRGITLTLYAKKAIFAAVARQERTGTINV